MRAVAEKWSKKAGRSLVGRLQEACQRTPDQVPASIPVVVAALPTYLELRVYSLVHRPLFGIRALGEFVISAREGKGEEES